LTIGRACERRNGSIEQIGRGQIRWQDQLSYFNFR
jgi:hypothetical protein